MTCEQCKCWRTLEENFGVCKTILDSDPPKDVNLKAQILFAGDWGSADLITRSDFGCVLFEQKESDV